MRISFDIDDTLVCPGGPREPAVPWHARWRYHEPLRAGTRRLLLALRARGCELWIYTTSHRAESYLRGWFRAIGIRLAGVVNQSLHERVVGPNGPSKYPPAFGIDLHVDDSEGVGIEGARHGFRVLVISPRDADWVDRVTSAVDAQRALGAAS